MVTLQFVTLYLRHPPFTITNIVQENLNTSSAEHGRRL